MVRTLATREVAVNVEGMAREPLDDALVELLARPAFEGAQVTHAVVFVLVAGAGRGLVLPDVANEYLGRLGAQLGLRPGAPPARVVEVMVDYFAANPVHPALRQALDHLAQSRPGGWNALAASVTRVLARTDAPEWLPRAPAAGSQVSAGPMARHALRSGGKSGSRKDR